MRVLVVEDQAELADDIADGLRDQGIGADVAYDGSAAIEKALLNPYDVVVLDRDLPRIHGDAAVITARIRATTSSGWRSVESIVTASGAARSGETARVESSRSRSTICARTSSNGTSSPRS